MKINTYKAVAYNVYCYKQFCIANRFLEFISWAHMKENFVASDGQVKHFEIQFERFFDIHFTTSTDNQSKFDIFENVSSDFLCYLKQENERLFDRFLHYYLSMKQKAKRTRKTINFFLDYINEFTSLRGVNDMQIVFLTFTFNNKYLNKLDNVTKRRYVTSFLNNDNIIDYIGNIDYGAKNGRIHFHVVALCNNKIDLAKWKYGDLDCIKANINNGALGGYLDKLANHELKVKILENATKKNGKQYNVYKLRCRNKRYDKQVASMVGYDIQEMLTPVENEELPFALDLKVDVQENVQQNNNSYVLEMAHNLEEELPF